MEENKFALLAKRIFRLGYQKVIFINLTRRKKLGILKLSIKSYMFFFNATN